MSSNPNPVAYNALYINPTSYLLEMSLHTWCIAMHGNVNVMFMFLQRPWDSLKAVRVLFVIFSGMFSFSSEMYIYSISVKNRTFAFTDLGTSKNINFSAEQWESDSQHYFIYVENSLCYSTFLII